MRTNRVICPELEELIINLLLKTYICGSNEAHT